MFICRTFKLDSGNCVVIYPHRHSNSKAISVIMSMKRKESLFTPKTFLLQHQQHYILFVLFIYGALYCSIVDPAPFEMCKMFRLRTPL